MPGRIHRAIGGDQLGEFVAVVIGVILALLFSSCPIPLKLDMVLRSKDKIPPVITIVSPSDGSSYAATVIVTGRVKDTLTVHGDTGSVSSLSYEVLATSISGRVNIGKDGSFTFQFPTTELSGNVTVKLTAIDQNGNEGAATLALVDGGAIPSFRAAVGNRQVILEWDEVPVAVSYTLHYTDTGGIPSPSNGKHLPAVESPLTLTDLNNGSAYTFLLQAISASGEDNWSGLVSVIPQSDLTLCPRTEADSGAVVLQWPSITGTDSFDILRGTSPSGDFSAIAEARTATSYIDRDIQPGRAYFYKIRPSVTGCLPSASSYGETSPFASSWFSRTLSVPGIFTQSYYDLVVRGKYLYDARQGVGWFGQSGVTSFSISDTSTGLFATSLGYVSTALSKGFALTSQHAYAAGSNVLTAIDIADPADPQLGDAFTGFADIENVAAAGENTIIVARGDAGIATVDVSNPMTPVAGALAIDTAGYAYDVAYSAATNCAIVADGDSGVAVVTLATQDLYHCSSYGSARSVVVSGDYAYVANGTAGFAIISLANPASPYRVSNLQLPGTSTQVALGAGWAVVAADDGGMSVIDIGDPTHPLVIASDYGVTHSEALAAGDSSIYLGSGGDLLSYSISPTWPRATAGQSLVSPGGSLTTNGAYVFALSSSGVLTTIDPNTGNGVGSCAASGQLETGLLGTSLNGSRVFAVYSSQDAYSPRSVVVSFDVSDPLHPRPLATLGISDIAVSVASYGDSLFVGAAGGILEYDVSEPTRFSLVGQFPALAFSMSVGNGCLVAGVGQFTTNSASLEVIDISSSGNPEKLGSCPVAVTSDGGYGGATAITVKGALAYLGGGDSPGFQVVNIENPRSPQVMGSLETGGLVYQIVASGHYALLDEENRVEVVDVSDPVHPRIVSSYHLAKSYQTECFLGSCLLLGDSTIGDIYKIDYE